MQRLRSLAAVASSRAFRHAVALAFALTGILTPRFAALASPPTPERARAVLQMFLDGKDDEFIASGTELIKTGLTADDCKQIRDGLTLKFGAFKSIDDPETAAAQGVSSYTFPVKCERGIVKLRVSLDADAHLAGFHIVDAKPLGGEEKYEDPDYVKTDRFRSEKVTLKTGKLELPGILSVPIADGTYPAVILVHGSGPHDMDESIGPNKPFRNLAQGLASRGIAVLRYEKRTHKYGGQMDPKRVTLDNETIEDAVTAVTLLRDRASRDIDPDRVFVLGHSLGGIAAPYIAKQSSAVAGIIIVGGTARPIVDVIEDQLAYITGLDGKTNKDEEELLKTTHEAAEQIRKDKVDEHTPAILGVAAEYWASLNKLDPVGVAKSLPCRKLVIQGGRDYQCKMADFELWKKALAGDKRARCRVYENLNHLLMKGDGKATPAEYSRKGYVEEDVINDIAEWILKGDKE